MNSEYYFVEHFKDDKWIPIGAWTYLEEAFKYSDSKEFRYVFINLDVDIHKLDDYKYYKYYSVN